MSTPILELENVSKSFGPIDVLHNINLRVHAGEVLCLLGDNGAGKSTLIKTLAGVYRPSSGLVKFDGRPVEFTSPREAQDMGIATVHQFGGTFPLMSIGRSFFVGVEPTRGWGPFRIYDRKKANAIAVKAVQDFGITRIDDGDRLIGGLSGGERQSLAIARAVHFGARVLILDEPTAGVDIEIRRSMWSFLKDLNEQGVTIILTTHYLEEAEEMADRIGVINHGNLLLMKPTAELMGEFGKKHLTIELSHPLPACPPELAERGITLSPDGLKLGYDYDTRSERTGIATLLADLARLGIQVRDVATKQSSLEEVFMALVTDKPEDAA